MDDRYRNLGLYQLAHSLAAFIHSHTLSLPGLAAHQAAENRRQSKSLLAALIDAYYLRESADKSQIALRRAEALTLNLLDPLGAADFPVARLAGTQLLQGIRSALEDLSDGKPSPMLEPLTALPAEKALSRALEGRTILITRPLRHSKELEKLISDRGGFPVVVPMIEIQEPDSWEATDREIAELHSYHGVIFTSQNAVDALVGRIAQHFPEALPVLAAREIFAVGEKTKQALENAQIPVTLIPETSSAADLAAHIREFRQPGRQYLFPQGSLAREELPRVLREANAVVNEIVVYRTVAPDPARLAPLLAGAKNGELDAVTFFSPSSVRNFSELIGDEIVHKSVAVCVGPSTAHEADRIGYGAVLTSPFTSAEGVAETLSDYFEHQPSRPAGGV